MIHPICLLITRSKPKQIKWIMTCVCLNGLCGFITQYFFIGMVRFDKVKCNFFAKLGKVRLFLAGFVMMKVFVNLYTEEIIDFALRS